MTSRINNKPYAGDEAFWRWLETGVESGFCSDTVCETHTGVPLEEWEEDEFSEGHDPCVHVVRLFGPCAPPTEAPDYSAYRDKR